jgi:hypothetical protein
MAYKGSDYQMQANTPPSMDSTASSDPSSHPGSSPQPIDQNPEAMQCIDKLQQMGYTADDVEQAMGGGDDQQPGGDGGKMATAAAPMQIPSMG